MSPAGKALTCLNPNQRWGEAASKRTFSIPKPRSSALRSGRKARYTPPCDPDARSAQNASQQGSARLRSSVFQDQQHDPTGTWGFSLCGAWSEARAGNWPWEQSRGRGRFTGRHEGQSEEGGRFGEDSPAPRGDVGRVRSLGKEPGQRCFGGSWGMSGHGCPLGC